MIKRETLRRYRWVALGAIAGAANLAAAWRTARGAMASACPTWLSLLAGVVCLGSAGLDVYRLRRQHGGTMRHGGQL